MKVLATAVLVFAVTLVICQSAEIQGLDTKSLPFMFEKCDKVGEKQPLGQNGVNVCSGYKECTEFTDFWSCNAYFQPSPCYKWVRHTCREGTPFNACTAIGVDPCTSNSNTKCEKTCDSSSNPNDMMV